MSKNLKIMSTAVVALAASACVSSAFGAAASFTTVGTLDPNNGTTINVSDSSLATTNGGVFVGLTAFQALETAAFAGGTGGVVNFEAANLTTGNVANTTIGDSQANAVTGTIGTNSFKFYRSDANGNAAQAYDYNINNGASIASGVSGGGYLGIQGTNTNTMTFYVPASSNGGTAFGTPIASFGLTDVARDDGQSSSGTFTVNYLNALTGAAAGSDTSSTLALTGVNGAAVGNGVFFGVTAPAGDVIGSVSFTEGTGASDRFDDLAVITAPTPEPASLGLLGLGGLTLLRRRR